MIALTIQVEEYYSRSLAHFNVIQGLSKSFFVINNISKDSNLINVSFSSPEPEGYIDCGTSTRTYEGKTYTYKIAGPSTYRMAKQVGSNAFHVYDVTRDTDIEGRINVYVAPENEGTRVSVNVKYLVTVTSTGTAETVAGALQLSRGTQVIPKETSTFGFNTNQRDGKGEITCFSNGRLESEILNLIKP